VLKTGIVAGLTLLSGVLPGAAVAEDHPALAEVKTMSFVGKKLLFRYDSGLQVEGHYTSPTALNWRAVEGPPKGQTGAETIHAVEITPGVFFISWLEKGGTSVSQVVDLNRSKVTAS